MNEKKLKQINGNAAQQAKVLQHDVKLLTFSILLSCHVNNSLLCL